MPSRYTRLPRMLILASSLLVGVSRPVPADGLVARSETNGPEAPNGLSVEANPRAKETLYRPTYDTWTLYDLRIYPILRRAADGTRSLLLYASTQADRRIGMRSLELDIDGSTLTVALKRSDVKADANGCRVLEDVLLEGQDDLIRRLATAREASVSVVSVRGTHQYRLSEEEIANFARIVALYGDENLPEPTKPNSAPEGGPEKKGLTNPQLIRSTRVSPEFPVMARDKMARGKVTLQAVVREDGSVDAIEVLKSSARYCGFEQAAIDALRRWRYEPGRQDGKPVDVYFTIEIDFTWR